MLVKLSSNKIDLRPETDAENAALANWRRYRASVTDVAASYGPLAWDLTRSGFIEAIRITFEEEAS
jgi:hypothetical protein